MSCRWRLGFFLVAVCLLALGRQPVMAQESGAATSSTAIQDETAGTAGTSVVSDAASVSGIPGPGSVTVSGRQATKEELEAFAKSRVLPPDLIDEPAEGSAQAMAASATGTPGSVAEMARALRHDPDLIYEYVRNYLEFYPIWGVQKGDLGTILDGQGTAFDLAQLMVSLLKDSGAFPSAGFLFGKITLNAQQIHEWLGIDTSRGCAVRQLFLDGGYGYAYAPVDVVLSPAGDCDLGATGALVSITIPHVWVRVNIDGQNYVFDPSFKPHTLKTGINLAAITGYSGATFLNRAKSGATVNANYVQNLNRTNVRADLDTFAQSLATHLRQNDPTAGLEDVIGGMDIVPYEGGPLRQTSLPYQTGGVTFDGAIDEDYKPTLNIRGATLDKTFTSSAIYGRRLTIFFEGSGTSKTPVLMLDGEEKGRGGPRSAPFNITFTIEHPYGENHLKQTIVMKLDPNGSYAIANSWGPASRNVIERLRLLGENARVAGDSADSETQLGSTLAMLGATWVAEADAGDSILDRLMAMTTTHHHRVGLVAYAPIAGDPAVEAAFVDLPANLVSTTSQTLDAADRDATNFAEGLLGSILESVAVEQTSTIDAVSTAKLVDMASSQSLRIFTATQANYAASVKPNLHTSCSGLLPTFQSDIDAGMRLILPQRCDLGADDWQGAGFYFIQMDGSTATAIGALISNSFGGYSTRQQSTTDYNGKVIAAQVSEPATTLSQTATFAEPIDMVGGSYLHFDDDIAVGVGAFPYSVALQRQYSSSLRGAGPARVGRGWRHNLDMSAVVGSDGFQGLGQDSAIDAAASVTALYVALDMLSSASQPIDRLVTANLVMAWFGEQLVDNTLIVNQGINTEVFVKLTPGAVTTSTVFNPPPGSSVRILFSPVGGLPSFTYQTRDKDRLIFRQSDGKVTHYVLANGVRALFTYLADGKLSYVENSFGRRLTFGYTGNRITSVSDGTGRSVSYTYSPSGSHRLMSFTDATAKTTTFAYDAGGRLTQVFYPSFPTTGFVTNVYDSLGRVQTQMDARGNLYEYFFAGHRSEELAPGDFSTVSYFDELGSVVRFTDRLGRVTTTEYDGLNRATRTVLPEGNAVAYTYDDASCASSAKRCTNNVLEVRRIAKPGSGLADLVSTFTYQPESAFSKVITATDPRGKVTDYTYDAKGNVLTVTLPPAIDGGTVRPQTTYGYADFTPPVSSVISLLTSETRRIDATTNVVTAYTYEATNQLVPRTTVVDSGGLNLTTTYAYDAVGNLAIENGPRPGNTDMTRYAYDAERRLTEVTDALGKLTRLFYDADGRVARTAGQIGTSWLVECTSYFASGKIQRTWGPSTRGDTNCPTVGAPKPQTSYAYNILDQLLRVTVSLTAAEGGDRVTEYVRFADGSVQQERRAVDTALEHAYATYTYTPDGQVATVADARGDLTTYEYDGYDRLTKTRFPDAADGSVSSTTDFESYTYDANGNMTQLRKRGGGTLNFTYDNLNQLTRRPYNGGLTGNADLTYNLLGQLQVVDVLSMWDPLSVSYGYDKAGRLISEAHFSLMMPGSVPLRYQYDEAGNRTRITWPDGFYATYAYDALNRATTIKENGSVTLATYGYDDLSRVTSLAFGNGTSQSYTYDPYSSVPLVATETLNVTNASRDATWTFTRNQALEVTGLDVTNTAYVWIDVANGSHAYTANGLNQYTDVDAAALSYTPNGNLYSDGIWTYAYDQYDRFVVATRDDDFFSVTYDGDGHLYSTDVPHPSGGNLVTAFLYSGADLVAEYSDNIGVNILRRYVPGPGIDEPLVWYEGSGTGSKRWFHADHQGSIVLTTDVTGTSTATYRYGPYGEPYQPVEQSRFRYTGQAYLPELGLYHYKARTYSPSLGRFLQTDPIGYADDLNLYAYVANDPINFTDPYGLASNAGGTGQNAANTVVGNSSGAGALSGAIILAASQGEFHDQTVRNLAQYLRGGGHTVITEVPLNLVRGRFEIPRGGFPRGPDRDSSLGCGPSRAVAGWPRSPRRPSATRLT